MNYIELINNFWCFSEENDIKANEIAVYFALLKYNNSLNWITSFRCDYAVICQYANVSKNTFYSSVNRLHDLGLIKYEKGVRNVLKPKISILKIKNRKGIIKEQSEEQNEEQKGNLYKLINKETIKLINNNVNIIQENLKKWITDFKKQDKKEIKEFSEEVLNCYSEVLNYFPEHLQPKKEEIKNNWLDTLEKLNRIDKIPFEVILLITKAAREDEFWSKNFMSLPKLRTNNKERIKYIVVFYNKFMASTDTKKQKQIDIIKKNSEGWG